MSFFNAARSQLFRQRLPYPALATQPFRHTCFLSTQTQILKLSDRAVTRVKTLIHQRNDELLRCGKPPVIGIRVGLKKRGCSGLTYTMQFEEKDCQKQADEKIQDKGVIIIVDAKAVMFLIGTYIDFVESEIGSKFTFENPNKKSECGCGQSFSV